MSGSRISVKGELVEEAKHRDADRDAASAIWGLEGRIDLLQTCSSGSRDRAHQLATSARPRMQAADSKPGCLHGDILVTFALPTFAPAALQLG